MYYNLVFISHLHGFISRKVKMEHHFHTVEINFFSSISSQGPSMSRNKYSFLLQLKDFFSSFLYFYSYSFVNSRSDEEQAYGLSKAAIKLLLRKV